MGDKGFELFRSELKIINIGAEHFAESLRRQNVRVEHVEFRPPEDTDMEMDDLLSKMGI
jgi:hypothetical protein